eukprot:s92_g17.t1
MSALAILITAIRTAICTLRTTASALEAAVERAEQLPGINSAASEASSDWDYIPPACNLAVGPAPSASSGDYDGVARLITSVPVGALELCSKLGGSVEEQRARAQRAWEAGLWARATIEGKVPKPRPSPKIAQKASVYVVLRAPGLLRPVRVGSAAEYFKIIPNFSGDSISHSFPSQAEARVYCLAAGIDYPAEQ